SGFLHILFTLCVPIAFIAFCSTRLRNVTPFEWLTIPLSFLFASHFEYWFHRYILHIPRFGLKKLYHLHSLQHHQFYTHRNMAFESVKDVHMVLFPLYAPIGFILLAGILGCGILLPFTSWNVVYLFMGTSLGFYLFYECCHFLSHLPPHSPIYPMRFG